MNDLSMRDQLAFQASKKSAGVTYALWFFLGGFGAHRFYLKDAKGGLMLLALYLGGGFLIAFGFASSTPEAPSAAIALGALFILAYAVTLFIDLFRIGGKVERFNLNLLK